MPLAITFSKYHGLGNDFLLLDRRGLPAITGQLARCLCSRRRGVGADGVLSLATPTSEGADVRMEVNNSDGSLAEISGNGLRCVAWHAFRTFPELRGRQVVVVETRAGLREATLLTSEGTVGVVRVDMGAPVLDASSIPVRADLSRSGRGVNVLLDVHDRKLRVTALSLGNPHAVVFDLEGPEGPSLIGPLVTEHPAFPDGVNVGFAEVREDGSIDLLVWERGVGETMACGSGACAAVVAAVLTGRIVAGRETVVRLPGGDLCVEVDSSLSRVLLTGPSEHVCDGTFIDTTGSPDLGPSPCLGEDRLPLEERD